MLDKMLIWFKKFWEIFSYTLVEVGSHKLSLLSFFTALTIFYLGHLLAKFTDEALGKVLQEKTKIDRGLRNSIQRFSRYIVLTISGLVALDSIGISIQSLAALGAVLMVGIGFGLQNIAQNFISGLIILLERPIKLGDIVKVDGISGRVMAIRARSTIIHTRDDVAIIVPNSKFISENVVNDSFSGDKIRLCLKVGVSYESDVRQVERILTEVAYSHPRIQKKPPVKVSFKDFADSSLNFELFFWTDDLWTKDFLLSDLRFEIIERFRKEGISIPFPQRDVHLIQSQVD